MAYTLIRGRFHIHYPDSPRSGPQPDGDTVKFEPADRRVVESLRRRGAGPDFNGQGYINIRFEAIDALETHYRGLHQPLAHAHAARDEMLRQVGYERVEFHAGASTVSRAEPLNPEGYVLSRTLDQHGRIVGFVFGGRAADDEPDGAQICLRADRVHQSINAQLLDSGLVHPSFYDTLPQDLREALAGIAVEARRNGRGFWPNVEGTADRPATVGNLQDAQTAVLFPKLFRRLVAYFSSGAPSLAGFSDWLREDPGDRDDALVLPPMEFGHLHDVVRVAGDQIWMTARTDEFVIIDTPETYRSGLELPDCQEQPEAAAQDLRIVAVLPNPKGADRGNETVTIVNTRHESIDLAGCSIRDKHSGSGMPLRGVLRGGDALRITLDSKVRLGNRGDDVHLLGPAERTLDSVSYTEEQARSGRTIVFRDA